MFNHTLWSCYNQTDNDFRIIVVCHEIPKLEKKYDERVEFISLSDDFAPIPKDYHEMMVDKGIKTHVGAVRVRDYGAGYTMLVDADDLISRRIVQFANCHPNDNGFYVRTGFVYFQDEKYFQVMHKFASSTAFLVNYSVDDLPSDYSGRMVDNCDENPWIIRKRHGSIIQVCKRQGRPLKPFPFIVSVYVLGTSQNHSQTNSKRRFQTKKRELIQKIERRVVIDNSLRSEFSIDWI